MVLLITTVCNVTGTLLFYDIISQEAIHSLDFRNMLQPVVQSHFSEYVCVKYVIHVFMHCSVSIDKVVVQYRKQREPRCDSSVLTNRLSFLQNQPSGHQIYAARQMKRRKIFKKKDCTSSPPSDPPRDAIMKQKISTQSGRAAVASLWEGKSI